MNKDLAAMYDLQQVDTAMARLQQEYGALDRGEKEQASHDAATAQYKAADSEMHAAAGALKDAELELKSIEDKRAEAERKLYGGSVRAPKELQALQDEIEMLGRRRERLDEKILELMDQSDGLKRRMAETKQIRDASSKVNSARKSQYKSEAERLVAEARTLAVTRTKCAQAVPPALLKRYESVRASHGGLAVVPVVEGNACGGCRMALSANFIEQVIASSIPQICENCGRIVVPARKAPSA